MAGRTSVLRPYQAKVVDRAVELYGEGTRRILVPLATGLGKTVVFTHLPQCVYNVWARQPGASLFPGGSGVLSLISYRTLDLNEEHMQYRMAVASFRKFLPHLSVGVEKGPETAHAGLDVVVASVQTLGRHGSGATRLRKYTNYGGVVVVDEAHHVKGGGMYDDVLNGLGVGSACRGETRNGRLLAGFTATPRRADGLSLRPFFDHSIGGLDLQWGIANGYLVDIHAYSVRTATDIAALPTRMQDFAGGALSTAVNNDVRNEAAARAMLEFGAGLASSGGGRNPRGIAFCADVRHAHDLARVLNEHNISAMAVDGGMSKKDRGRALSAFQSGEVSTLTNCGVLTEGFDAPFCDTIVMCRPTQSAPLYMQMIGRGTRPWLPPPTQGTRSSEIAGGVSTTSGRRDAIAASPKPRMHVIDLVDNCGKHKVMSMSTALGLSPEFCGEDGLGRGFSVEHVGSLAAEAMSLVDADGGAKVGDDCSHPLLEAKTPRELALLVKHYRLLQGSRSAETLLTVTGRKGQDGASASGWDVSQLSVGDRVGKNSFLRVVVETIATDGEEEEADEDEDDGCGDDEEFVDFDDFDDFDDDQDDHDKNTGRKSKSRKKAERRLVSRRHPRRKKSPAVAAATVTMRHPASGNVFSWRTAGVKDTAGTELHEGASYRLVATVKDVEPGAAGRVAAVGVTRCRLTLVTPDSGGSR
eukprot:g8630.t2